jgi:transposase
MPQKAGDRVKPDRRDAAPLARLARSGEPPRVDGPAVADAALRDRTRAREEPLSDLQEATCRLNAVWLSHDLRSTGRATWHPAHRRWRSAVVCPTPAQPRVFHAAVRAVTEHTARLQRLEQERQDRGHSWRWRPVGDALPARRGVQGPVAVTMGAELGALTRLENPRARRKGLGLMPAASSTGARRRPGSIPQAGTPQARRAMVAGAWAYRDPAQVSRPLQRRLATQPKAIHDRRWKAQVRRWKRSRNRIARGQHANQLVVAIARELSGLMGAIATEVPVTPAAPLWDEP